MEYARQKINGKHEHIYAVDGGRIVGHFCYGVDYPAVCTVSFYRWQSPCPLSTKSVTPHTPKFIRRGIQESVAFAQMDEESRLAWLEQTSS